MTYLEMFIAVLAIMLFATTAMVHNRGVLAATETLANATYRIQATQIAHEVLDSIDAVLLAQNNTTMFNNISKAPAQGGYNGKNFNVDVPYFGASFNVDMTATKCSQYGDTANPTNYYTRVDVKVVGPADLRSPVLYSRVFSTWK